jgi:hypothetical protein
MRLLELNNSDKLLFEETLRAINDYDAQKLSLGGLVKRIEECGENIVNVELKKAILDYWWPIEIAYASSLEKETMLEQDQISIKENIEHIKNLSK